MCPRPNTKGDILVSDKKTDPIVEEMNKRRDLLFRALDRESDRGVILVGTAFLDDGLEMLIRAKEPVAQ